MRTNARKIQTSRAGLIDSIRGLAIVSMVAYHLCYDIFVVAGLDPQWPREPAVRIWQQSICWTFILVSGYVWRWGRRHALRRGLMLNALGLAITVVTAVAVPSETVWFGILNLLGCATLLMIPLDATLTRRVSSPRGRWLTAAALMLTFAAFIALLPAMSGHIGIGSWTMDLPRWLYASPVTTVLGFPFPGFVSSDYFPLLPWFLLFVCGYLLSRLTEGCEIWTRLTFHGWTPLSIVGRHSLAIYLVHQPVCMGLVMLWFGL